MKKIILAALSALMVMSGTVGITPVSASDQIVTLSGAGPQGRWFKESAITAKLLNDHLSDSTGVKFNGVTGKGVSIGNIKRLATGKIEAGRGFLADLVAAQEHKGPFADDKLDYKSVNVWMTLNPLIYRLIADKSIKSYADLKGKTVAIGAKNSGDDERAIAILASYGVTAKNATLRYMGRSDAQNALINRQIDALLIANSRNNRGHLAPVFAARPINEDIVFVNPDPAITESFATKNPAVYIDTLGEPVFGSPKLMGVAVRSGFMIRNELSEDLVYKMTKAVYENWDEYLKSAPWMAEPGAAGKDVAASFQAAPYHPGAVKAYKEMGMWPN